MLLIIGTHHSSYILLNVGIVVWFGAVQMDEEEDVGPHVMLMIHMDLKSLQDNKMQQSITGSVDMGFLPIIITVDSQ